MVPPTHMSRTMLLALASFFIFIFILLTWRHLNEITLDGRSLSVSLTIYFRVILVD